MKKLTLSSIILLFIFLTPLQHSLAQETTEQFNLEIIGVETDPDNIRVGEESQFIVSYINNGTAPVPPDSAEIFLAVVDLNADGNKVLRLCEPVSFAEGAIPVAKNDTDTHKFIHPDCKFIPTAAGALSIKAGFVPPGTEAAAISAAVAANTIDFPIAGNANQNATDSITISVQPYESNLPDDLARVFAGLGIFFAIMAIVAVGTEVVIDTLKVALGFKSKVTATEGLEKMEKYMPGQLASLGVDAERIAQFKKTTSDMQSTLRIYLDPVEDFIAARQAIAAGEFKKVYTQIINLTPEIKTAVDKKTVQGKQEAEALIATARQNMNDLLESIITKVSQVFKIDPVTLNPLKQDIQTKIANWGKDSNNVEDLSVFLDQVFKSVREFEEIDWSGELARQEGWLEKQTDTFKRGHKHVLNLFKAQVTPLLVGVGFPIDDVENLQNHIDENLTDLDNYFNSASKIYVDSARNVINAVEQRRFQTQSPARKLWRALRSWEWGVFWPDGIKEKIITFLLLFVIIPGMILFAIELLPGIGGSLKIGTMLGAYIFIVGLVLLAWHFLFRNQAKRSIYGLYGVFVLSFLVALIIWLLIWLIQPSGPDVRLFGPLLLGSLTLPWIDWIIIAFAFVFAATIFIGEVIGSSVYRRLAEQPGKDIENWQKHTTLIKIETLWNLLREGFDIDRVDPDSFDKPDSVEKYETQSGITTGAAEKNFVFNEKTIGQFVLWRTDQQRDEEASRLRWLRAISFFVGLTIAYLLNIDAIAILGEAFPGVAGFNYTILSGETLNAWKDFLNPDRAITAGIILTGFAAAAGSTFWHDRLDQLQATKKGAETAADMLKQAQETMGK